MKRVELIFWFNNRKNHHVTFGKFPDYFSGLITGKIVEPFFKDPGWKILTELFEGIHGFIPTFLSAFFPGKKSGLFSVKSRNKCLWQKPKIRYRILAVSRFRTPAILFVISHI